MENPFAMELNDRQRCRGWCTFRNDNRVTPIATSHHVSCPSLLLLRALPCLVQAQRLGFSSFLCAYVATRCLGSLASFASAARHSRNMFTNSRLCRSEVTEVTTKDDRNIVSPIGRRRISLINAASSFYFNLKSHRFVLFITIQCLRSYACDLLSYLLLKFE